MNQAESERLGGYMEELGYQATNAADEADLVVLNSCVVRQSAENRVINKLNSLKVLREARPTLKLAVTGCLVDSGPDRLKESFPHVDHFFAPGDYPSWLDQPASALPRHPAISTFVPIMQGCDNFCTYCIVPYRRGRERSRSAAEIVCEVKELVRRGVKEVTLLGQNVDSYGHDLPGRPDLADLLGKLNEIEGLARMRFLTNHPKDMSGRLIEAIASLEKVCEQISLPVQSGSDDILRAMRRSYTSGQYRQLVARIRDKIDGAALSTDVIVGFPSEGETQFQATVDLLTEIRYDTVHIAAYSPRPGTVAAREYEDDVPGTEKKRRLDLIEKPTEINARLLGEAVEVLVENKTRGKWQGRTRTGKLVFFSDRKDYQGCLVKVLIEKTSPWSLQGKVIKAK
jgi:tRNA-2-methylthio-N6-dimethylallyladenosine synthase